MKRVLKFFYVIAQDAEKTLRILKGANQPLVKKRQVMRNTFGDYRAQMAEEEKKLSLGKSFRFEVKKIFFNIILYFSFRKNKIHRPKAAEELSKIIFCEEIRSFEFRK